MPTHEENEKIILVDNLKNIIEKEELELIKTVIRNKKPEEALKALMQDKKWYNLTFLISIRILMIVKELFELIKTLNFKIILNDYRKVIWIFTLNMEDYSILNIKFKSMKTSAFYLSKLLKR